jgi:hypothetical protein
MGSENFEVEKVKANFLFWMSVWGKPGIVEGGINSGTLLRGGLTQVEVGGTQWNSTDASGSGTRFPSSTSTILVTTLRVPT